MKIGFGSDHAAIELKACLLEHLKGKGYECVDFGAYSPEEKVDYPIAGRKVAEAIRRGEIDKGVLVCGTGVGISLAANKVPGIRAGVGKNGCSAAKFFPAPRRISPRRAVPSPSAETRTAMCRCRSVCWAAWRRLLRGSSGQNPARRTAVRLFFRRGRAD